MPHQNWHDSYKLGELKKESEKRVSKSKDFELIEENAMRLKQNSDRSVFSLNLDKYLAMLKEQTREAKNLKTS